MIRALVFLMVIAALPATARELSERIELSGFARAIAGLINDEDVAFAGYDDSVSLSEQSLFALQADVTLTDKLSVAAQALAHSADARESGIEWLYLNYQPTVNWQVKLGRLRTPFVSYSDVIDVGFAYPWISAPATVYGAYLFSNYEGISIDYKTTIGDTSLEIEGYWGEDETEINPAGLMVPIEIEDLRGMVFQLRRGNLKARLAYHKAGTVDVIYDQLQSFTALLENAGFIESAESLVAEGSTDALHLGLRYDTLDYFAEAEWLRIDTDVVVAPPRTEAFYVTLGRNFAPFQAHVTLGRSRATDPVAVDEIPIGVDPFLDGLAAGYQTIFDSVPIDNVNYASTGIRWDFRANVAAKAEAIWSEEESPSQYFVVEEGADFDGQTLLLQFGLEWVF